MSGQSERLAPLVPDDMSADQRALYENFRNGPKMAIPHPPGAGLSGPPGVWILNPKLAELFTQVSGAMRSTTLLSDRAREIALLLHAHHRASSFEVLAHETAGRRVGLSEAEITVLSRREAPDVADEAERVVSATTIALLDRQALSDAEYAEATTVLGERGLFELVSLIGFYDMIATQLAVFEVHAPSR